LVLEFKIVYELIRKLLEKDPKKRINAIEALNSQVFEEHPSVLDSLEEEENNSNNKGSLIEFFC